MPLDDQVEDEAVWQGRSIDKTRGAREHAVRIDAGWRKRSERRRQGVLHGGDEVVWPGGNLAGMKKDAEAFFVFGIKPKRHDAGYGCFDE